ncbi:MAG: AMP-binding protein [Actinobacteria bacterium]|nr:AMP-binding protein [Actinomycetota bacterium]
MLDAWYDRVDRFSERACIHYFDHTLSFADVERHSDALASSLRAGNLEAGARIGIYLQNDPQWAIALLAAWKVGAIPVALNPMLKRDELAYHLNDSGASVLVCLTSLYHDVVADVIEDTPVTRVITTHPSDVLPHPLPDVVSRSVGPKQPCPDTDDLGVILEAGTVIRPLRPSPDDVAVLTYTSGTTGPPKGAMNLQSGMAYTAQVYASWFQLDHRDVVLGVAPLFHITGLVAHLAVSWVTGAPLVLFHRFDPEEALRLTERWRASFVVGSITVFIALMDDPGLADRDLSSMTKVASGGAPVSPAIVERFERLTGAYIHNIYGLTETTSPSHLTPLAVRGPVDPGTGALSVGLPVPGAAVTVIDVEGEDEVPVGEIGELVISGPMVVPGYWEKPEESARALPAGRLHTGDVGFMDADGWFFIVDRKKDLINAGGYKVWPRDVEDVLYQHPAVRETAVVGVPDDYRGETVKAFVSLMEGAAVTPEELIAFCRERMAAYKYPRLVEILDELPKTPTGKFLRRELREV